MVSMSTAVSGTDGTDPAGGLHAVETGHPDVHEHDVGPQELGLAYGGLAVACLAGHLESFQGLDQRPEPAADDRMVVRDQHPEVHEPIMGASAPG